MSIPFVSRGAMLSLIGDSRQTATSEGVVTAIVNRTLAEARIFWVGLNDETDLWEDVGELGFFY